MAEPAAVPGVDPSRVSTPDELAACLNGLRRRRGLSYEAMEKAAAKLPSRSGGSRLESLPKSTVGEIVTGKRLPTKGKLLTFLTVCEIAPADRAQWLTAWERARTADLAWPARGIRVRDAQPRLLGVHAAISVPGVPDDLPPEYVPRDADDGEFGMRAKVEAAAQRGGFVLLVGGSSVGKTRCAIEAARVLLPDWWLVHPAGPAEVTALTQAPPPRTVVWLDELQRYLDSQHGLTGAVVRALLIASHPVVIIGTLWPDRYAAYTAVPAPGAADPHARQREVLDLAAVIRVGPAFSAAEQDRARAAAARDPRLKIALRSAGYGLTQTLAAAPQLVARWADAQTASPYAWAVLTVALDTARLGARAPLSADLLRAAAPGYCTSQQQAEAPDNWFEQALAYATSKLHGATAALSPTGSGMGHVIGYIAADYLIQHASLERRSTRVPATTWDAVLTHVRDPADAARFADSARNRLLYRYAIPLYRLAADAGDEHAAAGLSRLLAERNDLDELHARAGAGDRFAAIRLAGRLGAGAVLADLRARADTGGWTAAVLLAGLLAARGHLAELRARADTGDQFAAKELAGLLAARGHLAELRARADAGDRFATKELAGLLAEWNKLAELRARADAGDGDAAGELAKLLAARGDLAQLRARADAPDWAAAVRLAGLLASRGDLAELHAPAASGDRFAAEELGDLLAERGDLAELHARAASGDRFAAEELGDLLAERGDLAELRARAASGDRFAAEQLGDLLAERGDLAELRARADADDQEAAALLVCLLATRGDLNGLCARADVGDPYVAELLPGLLADLLIMQGRGEEAERLRQFGLNPDGSIACE